MIINNLNNRYQLVKSQKQKSNNLGCQTNPSVSFKSNNLKADTLDLSHKNKKNISFTGKKFDSDEWYEKNDNRGSIRKFFGVGRRHLDARYTAAESAFYQGQTNGLESANDELKASNARIEESNNKIQKTNDQLLEQEKLRIEQAKTDKEETQRLINEMSLKADQQAKDSIKASKAQEARHKEEIDNLKAQHKEDMKAFYAMQDKQSKEAAENTANMAAIIKQANEDRAKAIEQLEVMRKRLENASKEDAVKINQDIAAKKAEMADLERLQKVHAQMNKVDKEKGFGKMAGYEDVKVLLKGTFIDPVTLEKAGKEANIPNGMLFYGPVGTGKTRFAEALAEQADCHLTKIKGGMLSRTPFEEQIRDALFAAQDNFDKSKKRTIILLDEVEGLLDNKSKLAQFKNALNDSAKAFKATFFLTTNNPRSIDSELLRPGRIDCKVFLDPPDSDNAKTVAKYYLTANRASLDKSALKSVDDVNSSFYSNIAQSIFHPDKKSEGSLSCAAIKKTIVDMCEQAKKKVTENDLVKAFYNVDRDVKVDKLVQYAKDKIEIGDTLRKLAK